MAKSKPTFSSSRKKRTAAQFSDRSRLGEKGKRSPAQRNASKGFSINSQTRRRGFIEGRK